MSPDLCPITFLIQMTVVTEGPTVQTSCITVSEDGGDLEDKFYMQEDWEVGCDEALAIFD
ncbi:hypothetical protein DFH08DRAFT_958179 [Mycena albidolilacea]|uniref:Uncharacterized protein n=1 Tax=Mycena albidolilacea TaxID=1033008 RepID=A0AAD7ET48_9AGAR|nr:hypothetical protein DFH08DRAFT_958179 [Mycena albidolilacea]